MFCRTIKSKLRGLLGAFDQYLNEHIDIALMVTNGLKGLLTSPVGDILTAIIPGELDNYIRDRLVYALGIAVEALTVLEHCKTCNNMEERLNCFVEQLKTVEPEMQDALLHKLASLLSFHLDGQRLKQSMYDLYTQAKYSVMK